MHRSALGDRAAVVLAVVFAVGALLVAGCASSSGHADRSTSTSPSSTRRPSTSSASSASSEASSTMAVVGNRNGPVVSADGAQLARPSPVPPTRSISGGCRRLARAGATAECGTGTGATADLVWLIAHPASGGAVVQILTSADGRGTVVLQATDPDGSAWADVHVVVADVGGPPGDELLIGFRSTGTGGLLQVDAVGGNGIVLFHRELNQGRVDVAGGVYRDWGAEFGPNDANCCPSVYDQSVIADVNGAWRVVQSALVPPAQAPKGVLP